MANLDGVHLCYDKRKCGQPYIELPEAKRFVERHSTCFAVLLWRRQWQGRPESSDGIPPPSSERAHEFTLDDVVNVSKLLS